MRAFFDRSLSWVGIKTYRTFRLALRALALILGLGAVLAFEVLVEEHRYFYGAISYLLIVAASVLEFVVADVLADRSFPFETERRLALMERRLGGDAINLITGRLDAVRRTFKDCDIDRVSATVHIVTELAPTADHRSRKGLLQLTNYVGTAGGGRKGRITLLTQGVIGRCARTGKMETVDFANSEEYSESMVRDFGFTRQEATARTNAGRSYLAYPLSDAGEVVGTIYFFSSEPRVFPRAADYERLSALSSEIVNYLRLAQLI